VCRLAACALLVGQFMAGDRVLAEAASDANFATAVCDFDDGQEVSVRYNQAVVSSKDEPHNGKVWLPGGSPLTLFTNVGLTLNQSTIGPGAYSIFVIPNRKEWTLIVNRNVTPGAAYDQKQDIARSPMELGEIDAPPKQLQVSFAHVAPKTCSIRLYYGKVGAFTEFLEK
jgi:Protein of unknown function (DUF2911)